MRTLTEKDLNPVLLKKNPERAEGMLALANLANEMYAKSSNHPYLIGDCLLANVNLLKIGKKPRSNKK